MYQHLLYRKLADDEKGNSDWSPKWFGFCNADLRSFGELLFQILVEIKNSLLLDRNLFSFMFGVRFQFNFRERDLKYVLISRDFLK